MSAYHSALKHIWKVFILLLIGAIALAQPAHANTDLESLMGAPADIGANYALGQQVYQSRCTGFHNSSLNRAPQQIVMSAMRPESIYKALTKGVMKPMASG